MSLLQQDSAQTDDAARGEELTKGTSPILWAALAATAVVSIAIAIYVIAEQKPPVAKGEIVAVWAHAQHIVTPATDASGAPMPQQNFDQEMIFTQVRIHNQSDHPLFLINVLTNVTLADGIHSSYAANKSDYDRIFIAYSDMPVPHEKALSPLDTEIDPGQTAEGTFVSSFRDMTQQQWDARKKLDYTFAFRYQPNLVLAPQVPVTDH
jgi:hypothetical protein